MTIAALFVETGGCYFGLEGVDPWDAKRDARLYDGPWPVVAHPPCNRWSQLAKVVEARYGHKRHQDGGCFASALAAVRLWGGVLEHPAFTEAWPAFMLPAPPLSGGWVRGLCGGWAAHVEQGHYGHKARKGTWLYCFGVSPPPLVWGESAAPMVVRAWRGDAKRRGNNRPEMPKRERHLTPLPFRDLLLSIARSARQGAA